MSIKKRKKSIYPTHKIVATDLSELIYRFISDGWIADPALVDLPSFSKSDIDLKNTDISGDLSEHNLFSSERYFPSYLRSICTEFKLYFFADNLLTNGISVVSKFRLITLLKYLKIKDPAQSLPFNTYMNKEFSEGAIIFRNGVLIQFTSDTAKNNFYVRTIESGVDLTTTDASKLANERFVRSLFKEFSCDGIRKKKILRIKSIRKLCDQRHTIEIETNWSENIET